MTEICPKCGLPKDLCICGTIEREEQRIKILTTKRRYGKTVTIIDGLDETSGKDIMKQLKRKLGCGGTFKNGKVELQGDHKKKVKDFLLKMGYTEEQIEVI
ncbi:MAG: translation initiation factor [Candidatus Aenigmarchaeota archaeon]|nr:translation initiation factor [Candidatus Aenigmarchaeota archaeon]